MRSWKSQDLEAIGNRGVPIILCLKDRLKVAVGPSVTFLAVWKAKRPYLVEMTIVRHEDVMTSNWVNDVQPPSHDRGSKTGAGNV